MQDTNLHIALLVKIARAVYDVEEATTTAFDIILDHKVDIFFSLLFFIFERLAITVSHLQCSPDDQTRNSGFTNKISSTFSGSSSF